jgi:hypothetical protein
MSAISVRKQFTVETSQARAFRVFTEEIGAWWPLATHHISEKVAETAIIEPRNGGRWFERAADGSECEWGKVLVWDPPGRLVLGWQIGADWKYDADLVTEVDIRFVAVGPAQTRVELEHRLDGFGARAEAMRALFDSNTAWVGVLQHFVDRAKSPYTTLFQSAI